VDANPSSLKLFKGSKTFFLHVFEADVAETLLEPACYDNVMLSLLETSTSETVDPTDFPAISMKPPRLSFFAC
jgi:hypothetical protein